MMTEREQLFHEWKNISENINDILFVIERLAGIVQNDINIPEEQIKQWREDAFKCYTYWNKEAFNFSERIKELAGKTLTHLRQKEILYDVYTHAESGCVWYAESNQIEQHKTLVERQDGCVELYVQGLTKQDALNIINILVVEQGYTKNTNEES